jgi:3-hydroxypropanoate dehydrogenase
MSKAISQESMNQLFLEARSYKSMLNQDVGDDTLKSLYDLLKWAPTSVNAMPGRFLFIKSDAMKEKLYPALMESNIIQVKTAPVTVVIAFDENFHNNVTRLYPAYDAKEYFETNNEIRQATAFRNSSMQGAYLILAARALGLDLNPLSGFDNGVLDKALFESTTWKSNFLCTIGYGDKTKLSPRGPRLTFEESCKIV